MIGRLVKYIYEYDVTPLGSRVGLVGRIIAEAFHEKMPSELVMHKGPSVNAKGKKGGPKRKVENEDEDGQSKVASRVKIGKK
jgi:hypothetical protein